MTMTIETSITSLTTEKLSLNELTTPQLPKKSTENVFSGITTAENQEGTANKDSVCDISSYTNNNLSVQVSGKS